MAKAAVKKKPAKKKKSGLSTLTATAYTRDFVKTQIKPHLPKTWRQTFIDRWPEYNCKQGLQLMEQAFTGRGTDMHVIERMKAIVDDIKNAKRKEELENLKAEKYKNVTPPTENNSHA